ncbi:MAG: hypothetical protein WC829_13325 [Hyphomicrobium sp.]|jgi:hypothetical protein
MALALNGLEIVRSVIENPTVFTDVREQVQKAALAIVTAQFKSKTLDLDRVRAMRTAFGPETFTMLMEHLPDNVLTAVTKKIDAHNPGLKGATGNWHRKNIDALASGQAPAAKPAKAAALQKKPTPAAKPAGRRVTEENFYPKSMADAVGSRKKR